MTFSVRFELLDANVTRNNPAKLMLYKTFFEYQDGQIPEVLTTLVQNIKTLLVKTEIYRILNEFISSSEFKYSVQTIDAARDQTEYVLTDIENNRKLVELSIKRNLLYMTAYNKYILGGFLPKRPSVLITLQEIQSILANTALVQETRSI